jgi:hypothetical protein
MTDIRRSYTQSESKKLAIAILSLGNSWLRILGSGDAAVDRAIGKGGGDEKKDGKNKG